MTRHAVFRGSRETFRARLAERREREWIALNRARTVEHARHLLEAAEKHAAGGDPEWVAILAEARALYARLTGAAQA